MLEGAFLGLVQGLTEFIPVSSSGHLVLFPELFGWEAAGLGFSVTLHLGTLLAILVYFRVEWIEVVKGFFSSLRVRPSRWGRSQRLSWLIILATVPAAAAGAFLEGLVEDKLSSAASVAVFLAAGALAMVFAEVVGRKSRGLDRLLLRDAGAMGVAQVLALAPGMSRSGITMSAGMVSGLDREAAATFSFMMAAPIILGAGVMELIEMAGEGLGEATAGMIAAGFVTSAVVGFLTIKYLLRYLKRGTLAPFIVYSIVVAAAVLLVLMLT